MDYREMENGCWPQSGKCQIFNCDHYADCSFAKNNLTKEEEETRRQQDARLGSTGDVSSLRCL